MFDISFEELETFKTPDGKEWIVNPLKRKDLKKLNRFTALNQKLQKYRKEDNMEEGNKLIYGIKENDDKEETLLSVTDEIIDLSIEEVKTKEKFPEKYRRQVLKAIELCMLVVKVSTGNMTKKGDDTPLQMSDSGK